MFVIEDEAHAEPQLGEFTTFAEAVDELKRRAEKTTLAPNIMLYMYSTPRIATMLAIRLPRISRPGSMPWPEPPAAAKAFMPAPPSSNTSPTWRRSTSPNADWRTFAPVAAQP